MNARVAKATNISGSITTVVGGGLGVGTATLIGQEPTELVMDPKAGGVLETDSNFGVIREILPSGVESVIAGGGTGGLVMVVQLLQQNLMVREGWQLIALVTYTLLMPATTVSEWCQSQVALTSVSQ